MAQSGVGSFRRVRCDYKRLWAMKGLERLRRLIPNSSDEDEVKVIVDAMFYINRLEMNAEQLRKSVRRIKNESCSRECDVTSSEKCSPDVKTSTAQGESGTGADLPEDLKDVDEAELRALHPMPLDSKNGSKNGSNQNINNF